MKNTALNNPAEIVENRIAGTVGAFLFALAGGIIYFLIWQIGYLAAVSGIVAVVCAFKGYTIFAKKESIYGVVISAVASLIVIALAWYLCLSFDVYNAYREWYDEGLVYDKVSFSEAVRNAYLFLEEPEIATEYFKSLIIGILLCIVGCAAHIRNYVRGIKAAKEAQASPNTELSGGAAITASAETADAWAQDTAAARSAAAAQTSGAAQTIGEGQTDIAVQTDGEDQTDTAAQSDSEDQPDGENTYGA